jgi:hypothetical protein
MNEGIQTKTRRSNNNPEDLIINNRINDNKKNYYQNRNFILNERSTNSKNSNSRNKSKNLERYQS